LKLSWIFDASRDLLHDRTAKENSGTIIAGMAALLELPISRACYGIDGPFLDALHIKHGDFP
jgi:hypothetical protein